MTIDEFIARYEGVTVDVDGMYGGQCWDLWSRYAQDVYGVPQADTNTTDGWACSVYTTKYGQSAALQAAFDKLPSSATPRKGDVAFWNNPGWASLSNHVAIVLADQGANVLCLSQNPGPTQRMSLTKTGIIGYLRPKEEDMATAADIWDYNYNNSAPGGNVYNTLVFETQGKLNELKALITAQTAAITAMSQSMGADPDQIAATIRDCVKEKLDQLEITVTTTDGNDQ